jgi:hypothetical protein
VKHIAGIGIELSPSILDNRGGIKVVMKDERAFMHDAFELVDSAMP